MFHFLLLLLASSLPTQPQDFEVLELNGPYTVGNTDGRLTPTLFKVVLDMKSPPPAIRVSISWDKTSDHNPLSVNVIRGKTVHNIALPRIQTNQGKPYTYWFATDTLCDDDRSLKQLGQPVFLSIASSLPSRFLLRVKSVDDFLYNGSFLLEATPSEPRFVMYTFAEDVENVDIRAFSDSSTCARLIVRRVNCPLFDGHGILERSDVYFYQTLTKFAGFSVSKADIGEQFHLALTVMPDDSLCKSFSGSQDGQDTAKLRTDGPEGVPLRIKGARVSVNPVSGETFVSIIPLLVYIIAMIAVLLLTYFKYRLVDCYENNEPSIFEGNDSEANVILDKTWLFDKPHMIVSHKEYEKQRLVKDSKYFNFLFFQIFGAVLPALTTLFQNHQHSSNKQNLDLCYLNFLCSIKTAHFNSVNSILSVSSLGIVGLLNLIIVFRKKIFCYQVPRVPTTHGIQQREAPKVACLLGLVAFGLLGIINNNCPNKNVTHLRTYTCFWVFYSAQMWIYSKRHGVRKWHQFYIIAASSVFGLFTFVENTFDHDETSTIILKHVFLATSIILNAYFCYQYYYERPSGLQPSQWIRSPFSGSKKLVSEANGIYKPLKSKLAYIVLAMSFAVILPIVTLLTPSLSITYVCLTWEKGTLGIYFFYYLIQKIRFEWSSFSKSFVVLGVLFIAVFMVFELIIIRILVNLAVFSVAISPAESRERNKECLLPGIDWKIVLHYNFAFNWFMFIVLMDFIDSNLKGVPKKRIFVF